MRFLLRCVVLMIGVVAVLADTHAADSTGTPLFNGKDLSGWRKYLFAGKDAPKPDLEKNWTVVDGVIKCAGAKNGYIITEKDFENYTLKLKWKYPANVTETVKRPNSGVLLHVSGEDWIFPQSIEAQLANQQAGDLWLIGGKEKQAPTLEIDKTRMDGKNPLHFFKLGAKDKSFEKPLGEWNEYEIVCVGGNITLKVNGQLANEGKNGSLKKGKIGLQSEGAEIHFKDVVIQPHK